MKDVSKMSRRELRGEVRALREVAEAAQTLIDGCSFGGSIQPTENTQWLIDALAALDKEGR